MPMVSTARQKKLTAARCCTSEPIFCAAHAGGTYRSCGAGINGDRTCFFDAAWRPSGEWSKLIGALHTEPGWSTLAFWDSGWYMTTNALYVEYTRIELASGKSAIWSAEGKCLEILYTFPVHVQNQLTKYRLARYINFVGIKSNATLTVNMHKVM